MELRLKVERLPLEHSHTVTKKGSCQHIPQNLESDNTPIKFKIAIKIRTTDQQHTLHDDTLLFCSICLL